ncbi:Baculoviral IAP repeat-containing protein 6 [Boothiomyces macroporosus]|uniref:Baculoviral IAP repeat-containing protein 6 n=1 Tax=Boothiomyces macroporosus TaxID=261099 RepID=A0AAD5Y6L0_9FUNG|nr:Baculoviral IAP repeat-containing protein 6 [Boothiomyces macroporosus]
MESVTKAIKDITTGELGCSKCGDSHHKSVKILKVLGLSLSQFQDALYLESRAHYCFNCQTNICKFCGDYFSESYGSDVQDSDEEEFQFQNNEDNNLFHCTDSSFYAVYHYLMFLEGIHNEANSIENIRVEQLKAVNTESKDNGVGYASHKTSEEDIFNDIRDEQSIVDSSRDDNIVDALVNMRQFIPSIDRGEYTFDYTPHTALKDLLACSILGPCLKSAFKIATLHDLQTRPKLYVEFLRLLLLIAKHGDLNSYLLTDLNTNSGILGNEMEFTEDTIYKMISRLEKQILQYNKLIKDKQNEYKDFLPFITEILSLLSLQNDVTMVEDSSDSVTDIVKHEYDVEMKLPDEKTISQYIQALSPYSFAMQELDVENFPGILENDGRSKIVAKEIATLANSIPIDYGTSAFLRVDEHSMHLMQLCLVGPEGTPYANGVFIFDIVLPNTYPLAPPKFTFKTTGNGSWRANPNLYNNGKVCLSVLNTWSANQWIPGKSTLLQVIISIQAMILVNRPYFNEPGFGDPEDSLASKRYSGDVRVNVVKYAMIDQIKNPPPNFKEVVQHHFKLKKARILKQVEAWKEYPESKRVDIEALRAALSEL